MSGWGWIRARRFAPYDAVRVALGLLLLTAAALKSHQLVTEPVVAPGFLNSRWLLIAIVEFEFTLGVWMLARIYPAWSWLAAVGCFTLFSGISLFKAFSGEPTCGCFGKVAVNPWFTFALDSTAVLALLRWVPPITSLSGAPRVRNVWQWVKPLAALGALCGLAIWLAQTRCLASVAYAGLVVDPNDLNIGDVWEQDRLAWEFTVRNVSDDTLEIADIRSSCRCASVEPRTFRLEPGQATRIRAVVKLSLKPGQRIQPAPVPFAVELRPVVASQPAGGVVWRLQGRVQGVFVELPGTIDFGESCIVGALFPTRSIDLTSRVALQHLTTAPVSGLATCEVRRSSDDGQRFRLVVRPSETLASGRFAFPINLTPVAKRGEELPQSIVQVSGIVMQDVRATPRMVLFGPVRAGESREQELSLESATHTTFRIKSVECEDTHIVAVPRPEIDANAYLVSLYAAARGAHRSHVRFLVDQSSREYQVDVPVVYYGSEGPPR